MADKKAVDNDAQYKLLVKLMGELEKLQKVAKDSEDPRGEISEKAGKEIAKTAYETGVGLGHIDGRAVSLDAFKSAPNAAEAIKGYFEYKVKDTGSHASNHFSKNLETIVKEQVPAKTIEGLVPVFANDKEIMQKTSEKARNALAMYTTIKGLEEVMKLYKEKGLQAVQDDDVKKTIVGLAVEGASEDAKKKQKETQKKRGYEDSKLVELAGELAGLAVKLGYYDEKKVKKYALDGLEIKRKEIDKEYKAQGMDAVGAVRETLISLGKGSAEDFQKSMNLVYRGYRLAEEEKKKKAKNKK